MKEDLSLYGKKLNYAKRGLECRLRNRSSAFQSDPNTRQRPSLYCFSGTIRDCVHVSLCGLHNTTQLYVFRFLYDVLLLTPHFLGV